MHRVLDKLVFPVLAGGAVFLQTQEAANGISQLGVPEWIVAFVLSAVGIVWLLEKLGKLPGGPGERRTASFNDQDRAHLRKVTDLLATRIGDGSRERLLKMFDNQDEMIRILSRIEALLEKHLDTDALD